MRNEKKEKKSKKGRKEMMKGTKRKTVHREKRKEKEKGGREREDFLSFGRSKFDGSRIKVGARNAIHVWTPKSWSFDKLQKVGYFPTWFTFSLRAI